MLTTSAPVNSFFSFCGMRGLVNPIILMMKEGGNSTGKSQPIVKISKPQFSLPFLDVNKFNQLQLFVLDLHLQSRQMNISFNIVVAVFL